MNQDWPDDWIRVETLDLHTGGEPLRIFLEGMPTLKGQTMLDQRNDARENHDHWRRQLMWEPRGHADMYGAWPVDPVTDDGDIGVLFLHNAGYSTMCGHGIIALVTAGIRYQLFDIPDPSNIRIDTPAGRVVARANMEGGRLESVSFRNVPSFVLEAHRVLAVPELGEITFDIAFGGAFYAYVDAVQLPFSLDPVNYSDIIAAGRSIKQAVTNKVRLKHPEGEEDLNFLYGIIFVDYDVEHVHSRNVCVFADGEVDRSPTGTGVSGRAAIHYLRRDIHLHEFMTIESLIGSCFTVQCVDLTRVGSVPAIIPEVTGRAFVTGRHSFTLDPDDPLAEGFLLR